MRSRKGSGIGRVALGLMVMAAAIVVAPAAASAAVEFDPVADNPWMANGEVRAIMRHGTVLYVGGDFAGVRDSFDGPDVPPGRLAAFDAASGELLPAFQPDIEADKMVKALVMSEDGSKLFVGGTFAYVEGKIQRKLVALDPTTGARIESFKPKVLGGGIEALLIMPNGDLVIGGSFDSVNGEPRLGLARLTPDGTLHDWNPAANEGKVWSFTMDQARGRLVVSGDFRNINGAANTKNIAAFSLADGTLDTSFPVQTPYITRDFAIDGDKLYAAIGGPGGKAQVYNVDNGDLLRTYQADGDVLSVTVVDDIAYFGGHWLRYIGASPYKRFQGVRTDDLTLYYGFEPQVDGAVWEIEYDGDHIWLGGKIKGASPVDKLGFTRYSVVDQPDTDPPTVPGNLRTTEVLHIKAVLEWDASTDASGVDHYDVFRDGVLVGTTANTTVTQWGLSPETTYTYAVEAVDVFDNRSDAATLEVTTRAKPRSLISKGGAWRYADDGEDLGTAWRAPDYKHKTWPSGKAELGYGDGDERTVIADESTTVYFRKRFTRDLSPFTSVEFRLYRDDGAVVYLNGVEIWRDNMPGGTITHSTLASSTIDGPAESQYVKLVLPVGALSEGTNTLAVEMHQSTTTPDDLSFAMKVIGLDW